MTISNQNLPVNADFANAKFNFTKNSSSLTKNFSADRDAAAHDIKSDCDNTNVLVNGNFIGSNLDWMAGSTWEPFIPLQKKPRRWSNCCWSFGRHHWLKWNSAVNAAEKLTNIQALFHSEKLQKTRLNTPAFTRQHLMLLRRKIQHQPPRKQAQMFLLWRRSWPMDGCYRCSSLDVWTCLLCQTQWSSCSLSRRKRSWAPNVPVTWLVIQVKRSTTLQKKPLPTIEEHELVENMASMDGQPNLWPRR